MDSENKTQGEIIGKIKEHASHMTKGVAEALQQKFKDDLLELHTRVPSERKHQFVFMDIEMAGKAVGRLLFELFSEVCPKTSKNFEALCTGECGLSQTSGFPLCYKGSLIHRIAPHGWVQGGDISNERKGDGGESIYGPTFEDECFAIPHSKRGILGMANKGPHTNGSQFYITLEPAPWMDRTYVAFGQVVEGADVLRQLEDCPTYIENPKEECRITDCGVLTLDD